MSVDFDVLEFFKEEIKSETKITRIEAVKKTMIIAQALGPQRTLDELIPFLISSVKDEYFLSDEEYLYYLPGQFQSLAAGKSQQTVEQIVGALELLACQEETVIREAAVKSLSAILECDEHKSWVPVILFPMLERLAGKDLFTARVSACGLFPTAYKHGNGEQKAQLRKLYGNLCSEDTPMVRRAAASKLKDFVAVIEKQNLAEITPTFHLLAGEQTQDCIRIACIHSALAMSKILDSEELKQSVVNDVAKTIDDRSWRVRLTLAKLFDQVSGAFGADTTLPWLVSLLKDQELEVRKEAVKTMKPCIEKKLLTQDQLQRSLLPMLPDMASDGAQAVRVEVAGVLGPMIVAVGKQLTQTNILPIMTDLMKDEFHDVRLNAVKHTGLMCETLGMTTETQTLLNNIQGLIMDNQWRIRHSVVQQVPKLAGLFGVDMFQSKLEHLFISSLSDSVHSVRNAAIENHKDIATAFGDKWTVEHLLPKLVEQYSQNSGYSHRVTTLNVLPKVSHVLTPQQIVDFAVPLLINATKDTVPNVRFCACQKIKYMVENHNLPANAVNTVIKPALLELNQDPDSDVMYNTEMALKAVKARYG